MKTRKLLCIIPAVLCICVACSNQEPLQKQVLSTQYSTLEKLCKSLYMGMHQGDSIWTDRIVTSSEIITVALREDSKLDTNGARFVSMFIAMDNRKLLNRWILQVQKEWNKDSFHGCKTDELPNQVNGISIHRKVFTTLVVKGQQIKIPFPGTVVQSGDGFKVYGLVDPIDNPHQ